MNIPNKNNSTRRLATAGRFCITLVLTVACLLCVGCGARGGRKSSSAEQKRVALEGLQGVDVAAVEVADTINFGRVRTGEVVSRTFALHNTTQRPMAGVGPQTSCGCLWLDYDKAAVPAGAKLAVEMTFDSAGYDYFVPRSFYITTTLSEKAKKVVVVATME
ncbi:MAG: DUF1573 domain-containing protein [Tidjanibacter sp.]|nr:DUF1573 domain-containing protein [Tidjanibacter sp.]